MSAGRFIVCEGIDGSGKSSHIDAIREAIKEHYQVEVRVLREPGSTPLGEQLRNLVLGHEMSAHTEALLMFAARKELVEQEIAPALKQGHWVLCDRFVGSSYAYQGAGRRLGLAAIELLHHWCELGVQPDLTLYFDLDVETAQQRASQRGEKDRMDAESIAFFERVRKGYLDLVKKDATVEVLNSALSLSDVQKKAIHTVLAAFPNGVKRTWQAQRNS